MSKVVVLKNNSPEIRGRIENAGIDVCPCTKNAKWLYCHRNQFLLSGYYDVHGVGYGCEEFTADEHIAMFLHENHEKRHYLV